jgi:ferric iron reductase protein FhuF
MRKCLLSIEDRLTLEKYRVCFKEEEKNPFTIGVNDLFDKERLEAYLKLVQNELQAPDLMVAASAFSKRYSYLIVVPALYSFSLLNKHINMSVANLLVLPSHSEEKWLPRLFLADQQAIFLETKEEREEFRNALIKAIFAHHLSPLWESISVICKLPRHILWENTAIYVFWIYESLLQMPSLSPEIRDSIKIDFEFLIYEAKASLFNFTDENPFATYFSAKKHINGKSLRIRKTCCFSYKMSNDQKMCNGCPKKYTNGC